MNAFNFDFYCPTKIFFRPHGLDDIGFIISKIYHFERVFLVYGGSSFKSLGYYERVISSLNKYGVSFIEYSGIEANPDIEDVKKMIKLAREFNPSLVLACGGGSVIDACKSLCHGYYYLGDPLDFNKHLVEPISTLPLGVVLTLAASGSEMSDSCVISDRKKNFKAGFNHESNYPLFALLDPELTYSVPLYQKAIGLVDMFSHSFERYFSPSSEVEPCDSLALAVMKEILSLIPLLNNPDKKYELARAMMILGSLSHDGFTSFGKKKNFVVHEAEHFLSGKYPDLAHGQGIALLLIPFLEINKDILKDKIITLGKDIYSLSSIDETISSLEKDLNSLPIYHDFSSLPFDIKEEDIQKAYTKLKLKV